MEWVVRAGIAQPQMLIDGYDLHSGAPGIYGFSVQYAPGATPSKTIDELAQAGQFSNGQISYAYDGDLAAALLPLGYGMSLIKTPGQGYHHTFMVLYDASGQMLTVLPADAAQAISATFQRMKNPYRVSYRRHP